MQIWKRWNIRRLSSIRQQQVLLTSNPIPQYITQRETHRRPYVYTGLARRSINSGYTSALADNQRGMETETKTCRAAVRSPATDGSGWAAHKTASRSAVDSPSPQRLAGWTDARRFREPASRTDSRRQSCRAYIPPKDSPSHVLTRFHVPRDSVLEQLAATMRLKPADMPRPFSLLFHVELWPPVYIRFSAVSIVSTML